MSERGHRNRKDAERRAEVVERLRSLGERDATETALFQQAAAGSYGLGVTDMKALGILLREGPQTAGALMTRLKVTSGAVTGVLDRLVRAGVARRDSDPADRRRVIAVVDLQGLAVRENVYLAIGAAFERLYANYTLDELEFLARHLEASAAITHEQTRLLNEKAGAD